MKDFNLEDSKYITLDGNVWILPSSIAKLKGKDKNNYNNWTFTGYTRLLPGEEIRLIKGSEDWKQVLSAFRTKYQLTIAASEDVKLIDVERAKAYLTVDKPRHVMHSSLNKNNSTLTLPKYEEPTITSLEFSLHSQVPHRILVRTINRYLSDLHSFGPILFQFLTPDLQSQIQIANPDKDFAWVLASVSKSTKIAGSVRYCDLNENQCYFLSTRYRNSEFKKWLVSTFASLREKKNIQGPMSELLSFLPGNWEGLVQAMLCHLSTYTDKPFRQEIILNNRYRIDVLMSDTEALEIKNHIINPCHIKEIAFNKGYWFQLKEQLPNFKTLYITSTFGISDPALNMISMLAPEIQYVPLLNLFQKLAPTRDIPAHLFPST